MKTHIVKCLLFLPVALAACVVSLCLLPFWLIGRRPPLDR